MSSPFKLPGFGEKDKKKEKEPTFNSFTRTTTASYKPPKSTRRKKKSKVKKFFQKITRKITKGRGGTRGSSNIQLGCGPGHCKR